jgi:hypothetical protein
MGRGSDALPLLFVSTMPFHPMQYLQGRRLLVRICVQPAQAAEKLLWFVLFIWLVAFNQKTRQTR